MGRGGVALGGREELEAALMVGAAMLVGAAVLAGGAALGASEEASEGCAGGFSFTVGTVGLPLAIEGRAAVSGVTDRMTSHAVSKRATVRATAPPIMRRRRCASPRRRAADTTVFE